MIVKKIIIFILSFIIQLSYIAGCYRFGDPLNEETDSLRSDEEDEEDGAGGARGESRGSRWGSSSAGGPRDEVDSDEFADDEEGMSNQDSSSQEYLDDGNYLQYANNIRIHTGKIFLTYSIKKYSKQKGKVEISIKLLVNNNFLH